ncbi:MAG: hypothetical protein M1827_001943 [Pycnora praestabilis]|nr:MAG: hypothetical protein M1827_001943 [Pycnora praestabilis]
MGFPTPLDSSVLQKNMDVITRMHHLFTEPETRMPVLASITLASLAFPIIYRALSSTSNPQKVIASPRVTVLPQLTASEITKLPYAPDLLPGSRDVDSPFGSIRVYEWGPENGRKVLMVHGISTPCLALGGIAHGLVEHGCRVMLFGMKFLFSWYWSHDLWGRGYSDCPSDLPLDSRLYTSQILIALISSKLSWTGDASGGFSLVGYSLGGGIASAFASSFPHLVNALVLLAPSGIIRPKHINGTSKFLYSTGLVPESLLQWLVKRRLGAGPMFKSKGEKAGAGEAANEELPKQSLSGPGNITLSKSQLEMDVAAAVDWQIHHHQGFIPAFMSSIRFAPITGQQSIWKLIGDRLSSSKTGTESSLTTGKVLVVVGETDPIIIKDELRQDATELFGGEDNIEFRVIQAGHEFPISKSEETVNYISNSWGLKDV